MNRFKHILALALVLVMAVSLVACTGNTDASTNSQDSKPSTPASSSTQSSSSSVQKTEPTLKVKVVDEKGNIVVGVGVQLCKADGTCTIMYTDEEGFAGFTMEAAGAYGGYTVNIASLADYTVVSSEKEPLQNGQETYELVLKVTYRIKVVDAQGNPVAGETVTLVNQDNFAATAGVTNADGYVEFFNEINDGYEGCFGDHSNFSFDGVEMTPFEKDANELVLVKS